MAKYEKESCHLVTLDSLLVLKIIFRNKTLLDNFVLSIIFLSSLGSDALISLNDFLPNATYLQTSF